MLSIKCIVSPMDPHVFHVNMKKTENISYISHRIMLIEILSEEKHIGKCRGFSYFRKDKRFAIRLTNNIKFTLSILSTVVCVLLLQHIFELQHLQFIFCHVVYSRSRARDQFLFQCIVSILWVLIIPEVDIWNIRVVSTYHGAWINS
jgi:hypothetical protein